jgi:dCMP deaminase
MNSWDEFFIKLAFEVSKKSKDPSTKVGCVLVGEDNVLLSIGFNGFPRGVLETEEQAKEYFNKKCGTTGQIEVPGYDPYNSNSEFRFTRWGRPQKYSYVEHAERNSVYNAARHGIRLQGARAYLNWSPHPCADCTRALIQAGIVEVIGPNIPFAGKGAGINYSLDYAKTMFDEAEITQREVVWEK